MRSFFGLGYQYLDIRTLEGNLVNVKLILHDLLLYQQCPNEKTIMWECQNGLPVSELNGWHLVPR